jgi:Pyruvate/2-oxoacid:ferredoxin oxidoreductase delta subunit
MLISLAVQVKQVYQVACTICGVYCVEGETYDYSSDAESARQEHIQEHKEAGH